MENDIGGPFPGECYSVEELRMMRRSAESGYKAVTEVRNFLAVRSLEFGSNYGSAVVALLNYCRTLENVVKAVNSEELTHK